MKKPPARKPKTKKAPKPQKAKPSPTPQRVERVPGTWDKIVSLVKSAAKMGRKPPPTQKKQAPR